MSVETALAQEAASKAEEGRLSFREKVGYALGDAASNFGSSTKCVGKDGLG